MGGQIGGSNKDWQRFFIVMTTLAALGLILGTWKLIEVAIWFFHHVRWV